MDIYTPLEEAKEEILRRWSDKSLRKKVEEYLGEVPAPFQKGTRSVLYRDIISPNKEFSRFLEQSKHIGFSPLGYEYYHDKFCTTNKEKLCLAKMPFYKGKNKNGEVLYWYRNIVDINKFNGKRFDEIETLWGEPFIDFHHRLLNSHSEDIELFDGTSWYSKIGINPKDYYKYDLALFICHGILFENFVTANTEAEFCRKVVYPAYTTVIDYFGVKPLIVELLPHESQSDIIWSCYPEELKQSILPYLEDWSKRTDNQVPTHET